MTYLIVPCFNEEQRLRLDQFAAAAGPELFILFANDGSTDKTSDLIQKFILKHPQLGLYSAPQNMGKGAVVRAAFQFLQQNRNLKADDWIGYWDADLATPLSEVANMKKYAQSLYGSQVEGIYSSRIYRLGSRIIRSSLRHYCGRAFATVISLLLRVESYDSQCGAKLFTLKAAEKAFAEPFISRWIFDVEILMRLEGLPVIEYPLLHWEDIPGSKIKIFRESLRIFKDILRIRARYL